MARLFIPAGIPGAGKSTWCAREIPDVAVVSTDDIRRRLVGSLLGAWATPEQAAQTNRQTFDDFHAEIASRLASGQDVVADATNLLDYARERLRLIAAENSAQTHLVIFTDLHGALQRNEARPADQIVPADGMNKMLCQYAQMVRDLPGERYDAVVEVR